jgi:glycosyltransferase involved in cell wall biosynthesis
VDKNSRKGEFFFLWFSGLPMETTLLIIFVILVLLQVLIMAWLLAGIRQPKKNSRAHAVSVVIAARNEAQHLKPLITSLMQQDHPNFEVVLVNDRSTDETAEILSSFEHMPQLKYITIDELPPDWTGKKYALKRGIQEAQNEVLLFTDADCLPIGKGWIRNMTAEIDEQTDVVVGYSKYQFQQGMLNQCIQFDTLMTALQYLGLTGRKRPYMVVGRNWAIKKAVYPIDRLQSISNIVGGDDDLMAQFICNQKNTKMALDSAAFTVSTPEKSWQAFIKQKTRHLSVGVKYSTQIKTILAVLPLLSGGIWIAFLLLLFSGSWKLALLIFGIRSLSIYIIFKRLGQKLETDYTTWALPIVELCYPFWNAFLGIRSLSTKHIEWKAESSFLKKH